MWQYNRIYLEIYHHGILGMKWGIRNGPPYPLGASDHSVKEQKAGWQRSLGGKRNPHLYDQKDKQSSNSKKHGLTDKQKKALKIGVAVTATALVAIGGVYLYKTGKLDDFIKLGKEVLKKDDVFTPIISIKGINGGSSGSAYGTGLMNSSGIALNTINCQACTLSYELRNRGYSEAFARAIDTRQFRSFDLESKFFKNVKLSDFKDASNIPALNQLINELPPNSRGNFLVNTLFGGHSMAFQKTANGAFKVIDCQSGKIYKNLNALYSDYGVPNGQSCLFSLFRTDNLELNDFDYIKQFIGGI